MNKDCWQIYLKYSIAFMDVIMKKNMLIVGYPDKFRSSPCYVTNINNEQ